MLDIDIDNWRNRDNQDYVRYRDNWRNRDNPNIMLDIEITGETEITGKTQITKIMLDIEITGETEITPILC